MNERIHRSDSSNNYDDEDFSSLSPHRRSYNNSPQYSDVCSQLSLEQLLEEDKLVMSPAFRNKPNNNNNPDNPISERIHRPNSSNNNTGCGMHPASRYEDEGLIARYEKSKYGDPNSIPQEKKPLSSST